MELMQTVLVVNAINIMLKLHGHKFVEGSAYKNNVGILKSIHGMKHGNNMNLKRKNAKKKRKCLEKNMEFERRRFIMKKYLVTIARFGFVEVEAENELKAMNIADNMKTEDISWSDDWEATDAREDEEE